MPTSAPGSAASGAPVNPATAPSYTAGPASGGPTDSHWFDSDDYLIATEPLADKSYVYVRIAKMREAPSAGTKDEGKFFDVENAKEVWTQHFWRTRPATAADLQIGNVVICFEGNQDGNEVYQPPSDRDTARTANWWMAKITDTTDLYKNRVRVSTYSCAPAALRVPQ